MASGKKTDETKEELQVADAGAHVENSDAARVDDVPDRLLILANRLQKALDSRRATASTTDRSDLKKS